MGTLVNKLKPAQGFSYFFHLVLNLLLPALIFVLVRINFVQVALAVIILSKWRMISVRPRHWPANIRANAVDIIVGVSALIFMVNSESMAWQLGWAALYAGWLLLLKPISTPAGVAVQSLVSQSIGLTAWFLAFGHANLAVLMFGVWAITYFCARHFLSSFDEPLTPFISYTWAFFAGALTWILGHWLLFYGFVAMPTLLLSIMGFSFGTLYYLQETDRLSGFVRRQIITIMVAVIIVVLVFSDWSHQAI